MNEGRTHEDASTETVREAREVATAWLIRRYDYNEWSEQDQSELDDWLEKSPSHMVAYLRVEASWRRVDRLRALRRPTKETRRISPVLKIAAALSIVVAVGVVIAGTGAGRHTQIYTTQLGEHKILTLGDGSQVELNTNTRLRADLASRTRTVWLDSGEAYFQVRHDSARPFVVFAAGHRLTDLGTKFLVRAEAKRVRVALIDGEIKFESSDAGVHQHSAVMTPGDIVVATADSMSVSKEPARQLQSQLGWRRGLLVFRHTTLQDAVDQFNRYNREKLVAAGPGVGRLTIDGTFRTTSVQHFTEVVQAVFGLQVKSRGDTTVISR